MQPNRLTQKEVADGWLLLFDGKTGTGWQKSLWTVGSGELVSPGDNSPLESNRSYKDFELELEFKNEGGKVATLGFGNYSEKDSHPVRIYLRNNNLPGWHKLRITAKGTDAAGVITSFNTGDAVFPEAVIRENPSTLVPLVFKGANLRLRNIKLKPINAKANEARSDPCDTQ